MRGRQLRRPEFIARQAGHPAGVLGRILFRVMAAETAPVNQRALALLAPEPNSRVLEIGFGHGRTLTRAAQLAYRGFVAGIDISADMVQLFRRRNRTSIAQGLIEVKQASSDRIPYPDADFDRSFAVHTIYFWDDPLRHLAEIRRVMTANGRFVLAFTPKEDGRAVASFPRTVYRFRSVEETMVLLSEAASAAWRCCERRSGRGTSSSPSPIGSSKAASVHRSPHARPRRHYS
jgi:ubiquinone/menaquinone biosynthesis C-methylase UbiE